MAAATVPTVHRFLLTRHGQSEWNALGIWQGRADPPLSPLGRRQAVAATRSLDGTGVVTASSLQRARQTAEIISDELGLGPVLVEPDLMEREAGEWSGLTRDEIELRWPGYLADGRRPAGYEPDEHVLERALRGISRLCERVELDTTALVVTHGGVIYALERHLGAGFERIPNMSGRWLTVDGERLALGERLSLIDGSGEGTPVTVPNQL